MIISVETEKHLTKFNAYLWFKKKKSKLHIVGNFLNLIKNIYNKPTENLVRNGEQPQAFLQRLEMRKDVPSHHSSIALEGPTSSTRQEKEIKGIQIEKEKIKIILFTDDKVAYVNNTKE